jgi:ribosomal protein L34E
LVFLKGYYCGGVKIGGKRIRPTQIRKQAHATSRSENFYKFRHGQACVRDILKGKLLTQLAEV